MSLEYLEGFSNNGDTADADGKIIAFTMTVFHNLLTHSSAGCGNI